MLIAGLAALEADAPRKYGDKITQELVGDTEQPIVTRIELVAPDAACQRESEPMSISRTVPRITICGIPELGEHSTTGVTHVLSILGPNSPWPKLA